MYQLTMAKLIAQASLQRDDQHRPEPGSRHLSLLFSERGPAASATAGSDDGNPAAAGSAHQAAVTGPAAPAAVAGSILAADVHTTVSGASDQLRLVSKILLQHKDSIQQIRQDRGFMLFFREDQRSLLPSMMAMSKEWNLKKEKGDPALTSPLRTVLFANVIKELLQRMPTIPKTRGLTLDQSKPALQHDAAVKALNLIHSNMKGEIVQSFHST